MTTEPAAPVPEQQTLPLFFTAMEALDPARHGHLKIDVAKPFKHARTAFGIPITLGEFGAAGLDYPIVFTEGATPGPLVVVGVRAGENLFVGEEGGWEPGAYVPAYARCYPFAVGPGPTPDQLVVAVDPNAECLSALAGRPLFEDGKPSAVLDAQIRFCQSFQDSYRNSLPLLAAMDEAGILMPYSVGLNLPNGGGEARITGFRAVDPKKFAEIPDKTFLAWRKKGYLGPIYQHLQSIGCWNRLVQAFGKRGAKLPNAA